MTLLACGLAACTTSTAANGTGGSSGSGAAGTTTASGTGGSAGVAGATGTTGNGTLCPPPDQLITNFAYTPTDGAAPTEVSWGNFSTTFSGETNIYGPGLTSDVSKGNWHISGTVSDYSGLQLLFNNCDHLDASKFTGISLTISGSVPHGNAITMAVATIADTPSATWLQANGDTTVAANASGICVPTSGTQYYHPGCGDPTASVPVSSTATPVNLTWSQFTGGQPDASPNPAQITSIYWLIPWTGSTDTSYPVDITIYGLSFTQ
jgi:hypothetical protein